MDDTIKNENEHSSLVRLAIVVGDFLLLGISYAVIIWSGVKFMFCGPAELALWVSTAQRVFVVAVIGFVFLTLFTAVKGGEWRKVMFWMRIIYLVIWIVQLVGIAYTPAAGGSSC